MPTALGNCMQKAQEQHMQKSISRLMTAESEEHVVVYSQVMKR